MNYNERLIAYGNWGCFRKTLVLFLSNPDIFFSEMFHHAGLRECVVGLWVVWLLMDHSYFVKIKFADISTGPLFVPVPLVG